MAREQGAYSMSRRGFCRASLSILIAPRIAIAQGPTRVRRIGVLYYGGPQTPEEVKEEAKPLRELGWVEGQNLYVERRFDNGQPERLQAFAGQNLPIFLSDSRCSLN